MGNTPIFGPFYVSRSPNLADQHCINLVPEVVETKTGKEIGALYLAAGLDLKATLAASPVSSLHNRLGATTPLLYAVAGASLFSLDASFNVTAHGAVTAGPVSWLDNGTQVAIFTGTSGFIAPGGFPLAVSPPGAGGYSYSVGDNIVLTQAGGTQIASAIVRVASINASGAVLSITVVQPGSFPVKPTSFTQTSTTGSGQGFTIAAPVYGAFSETAPIALPFTPTGNIAGVAFLDGYGFMLQPNSAILWQSNLEDLSIWQALNFGSATGDADNAVTLAQINREIFIIKQYHTEVWVNVGSSNFILGRLDGVYIEYGTVAAQSVAIVGELLIWLSQTLTGEAIVIETQGHRARRISTFAVETAIRGYSTIADAQAYSYQEDGHDYYVLTFPTADATWVYDVTVSALLGIPMWHERGRWDGAVFHRHISNCVAFFNGLNIVGDFQSGNLYAFNRNTLLDNNASRRWLRSWRALPKPSEEPVRFTGLRIDMQTGQTVTDTPQANLRWSDDGGWTWSASLAALMGAAGASAQRVMFRRLGSTRRNHGLDRIFELSGTLATTQAAPVMIIGADLQP